MLKETFYDKRGVQAFIKLKQADMPFNVKDRGEALPLDERRILVRKFGIILLF